MKKRRFFYHLTTVFFFVVLLLLIIGLHDSVNYFGLYDHFHPFAVLVVWGMIMGIASLFGSKE